MVDISQKSVVGWGYETRPSGGASGNVGAMIPLRCYALRLSSLPILNLWLKHTVCETTAQLIINGWFLIGSGLVRGFVFVVFSGYFRVRYSA